jgi:hypothetical protein
MSIEQSKLSTPARSPSLTSSWPPPTPTEQHEIISHGDDLTKHQQREIISYGSDGTQRPTTPIDEVLPRHGISVEKADKWILEYNRESLPIMHDDTFRRLLLKTSHDIDPADPAFELKMKSIMDEKTSASKKKWSKTFYKIFLAGPELFPNDSLKSSYYISALSGHPTILGLGAFIAECLPEMVEELQKRRSEAAPKKMIKAKRALKSNTQRVSKSSGESNERSSRRRSPRIKKLHTPSESSPSSSDSS